MTGLQIVVVLSVGVAGVFGLGALAGAGLVGVMWRDSVTANRSVGGRP